MASNVKFLKQYFGYPEGTVGVYDEKQGVLIVKGSVLRLNKTMLDMGIRSGQFQITDDKPTKHEEPQMDPEDLKPIEGNEGKDLPPVEAIDKGDPTPSTEAK